MIRFTNPDRLKDSITRVLRLTAAKCAKVIFMSTGNVGLAPVFFPTLNWVYTVRTLKSGGDFHHRIRARRG